MRSRFLILLVAAAACSSGKPKEGAAARWEIEKEENLAVPVCPRCEAAVLRTESKCPGCGAACHVQGKSIDCPECGGTGAVAAACEACDGTGKCAICEGKGTFEAATCPECDGGKSCGDCRGPKPGAQACANCAGTGRIALE